MKDASKLITPTNVARTLRNIPISAKPITISNEGLSSCIYIDIVIVKAIRSILFGWGQKAKPKNQRLNKHKLNKHNINKRKSNIMVKA